MGGGGVIPGRRDRAPGGPRSDPWRSHYPVFMGNDSRKLRENVK